MKSPATLTAPFCFVVLCVLCQSVVHAQPRPINYDESKVPHYILPDPLVLQNGNKVVNAADWQGKRRLEILQLFQTQVYGRSPGRPKNMTWEITSVDKNALSGKATRKEISIYFEGRKGGPKMDLLLYLPNNARKPAPAFVGLNFNGNHSIHSDPGITLS